MSVLPILTCGTIPHKFSQQGPGLAVGDANRDAVDDFIVGGPAHLCAKVFIQEASGKFHVDSLAGYYDAGIGVYALGKGDGTFEIVPPKQSGF